ncbi:hypothetical protein QYE76_042907 [Lolium multiflorum]|uniref:CCHC-type domain-containing protein n=1 Tax=Lolium multiflorum TaxID=4521 RepID=A0AAD8TG68_LOLMU|nr:hypothetical protein QYE76_042907 [Lolium multiflorum]
MTVTLGTGDAAGDASGDPKTPPPATVQPPSNDGVSPDRPLGGRFWLLESVDEDGEEKAEISPSDDIGPLRYLWRSPESEMVRDLKESPQELARRATKRINRQQQQRRAAMELMVVEGESVSPNKMPLGMSICKSKPLLLPVLEPSVFVDDGQDGWTVVRRRRWSPASGKKRLDPKILEVSKYCGMGPMKLRPRSVSVGRGGPGLPIHRRPTQASADRSAGTDRPIQAVVAAVTAAQKVPEVNNASTSVGTASHGQVMPVPEPVGVLQQPIETNKDAVEPPMVHAPAKENEGPEPSKKKKEDKDACFRCKKPGHHIDDCTTPFCAICESVHHISLACHLLQAPKPTVIMHEYANEALMFFEMPCGAFKAKVENPKLAKVTVEGEVEGAVPQEVNMDAVNDSMDGGGDPNNGAGNVDGGNEMDMDAKGSEDVATSNNNGHVENNTKDGAEGMQEQCQKFDDILIGTMKLQLSPKDSLSVGSSSGLPEVGSRACLGSSGAPAIGEQQFRQSAMPMWCPDAGEGSGPGAGVMPFAQGQQGPTDILPSVCVDSTQGTPLLANGLQGTPLTVGTARDKSGRARGILCGCSERHHAAGVFFLATEDQGRAYCCTCCLQWRPCSSFGQ